MSNIYKHFNDIDVDINKINSINVELDDITKKRIKNQLRNSVTKKNKSTVKILISVASIFLILISVCIFSKDSITAFAENIPLLNSLFQNYSSTKGGKFQDYTQVIGETKKDKGYEVTLEEVVMDESTFVLIYTIKCPEKVSTLIFKDGNNPFPHTPGKSIKLNGKDFVGGAGGSHKIIDDYTVQVIEDYEISKSTIPNNFNIEIDFKELNQLEGDWKFSFHSSKEKISKDITNFTLNKEVKIQSSDGKEMTLTFQRISFSPISTAIYVTTNDYIDYYNIPDYYNLIFKDDNGNIIKTNGVNIGIADESIGLYKGLYKLESMDKIPKKILVEYKPNGIDEEQIAVLNLN